MRAKFLKLAVGLLCIGFASAVPNVLAKKKDKPATNTPAEQRRAVHALNRLTFGPRPGDVQQVMAMGVDRWIDEQLHPEKISDDAMDVRLAPLRTLHMSTREIVEEFPDPQILRMVMDGKKPMPSDPARRAIYQVQVARLQERLQKKQQQEKDEDKQTATVAKAEGPSAADSAKTAEELTAAANDDNSMAAMNADAAKPPEPPAKPTPEEKAEARQREDSLYADLKIQSLVDLPAEERYRKILAMPADEQIMFADSMRGGRGQEFVADMNPKQKETLLAMNNPQGVVVEELAQAKLLRAIYSERQLEEVMTDFWFNHFNIFVGKGQERLLLTNYEQDVIRPHALGKFEDLLVATAKSPAMLFFLDNWLSVGPNSMQAQGIPARPMYGPYGRPRRFPPNQNARNKKNSGLNENYGRELLELHTLSVNGGYSQRDVTEVAKVFTGWTIEKPFDGMTYRFDPRKHEPGPKFVLGKRIKPNGEGEGREVLHMLASSPQTAHFISFKLAQRFVSDDPPAELVDRMAKTFEKKKGDIREVLSTLFQSPEFWADTSYRAKVKTPLEFVASAVRATGADVTDALPLARQLSNMGMPLYGAQPPTGYSMKAETWVSSSALLNRMNFALALTAGKVRGVKVDVAQLSDSSPPDSSATLTTLEAKLLAAEVSKQTHDSIMQQTQSAEKVPSKPPNASTMAGLLIGSPEFQRR
ncbi:MAG TPA: DUF1800 family protein [Candidatus Sulfotelmatobacter sp.]|nr:DUF1800 family protein [Candidatus Sulfotelmatobacter sp.]